MALSFEESKKLLEQQAATPAVMSLSADEPMMMMAAYSGDETFYSVSSSNKQYTQYSDEKFSFVDEQKNVTVDPSQINITQEQNSQYIPFEMPRYYDGIDLSTKTISIQYLTSEGVGDRVDAVNVERSETKIRFGWLVPLGATQHAGELYFEIQAHGTNEKGNPYMWKTKPNNSLQVIQSLATDGIIRPDDYNNWYTEFTHAMDAKVAEAKMYADMAADATGVTLDNYYKKTETYNRSEIDSKVNGITMSYANETITFKNNTKTTTIDLQITEKVEAAAANIDGLADFGVNYDFNTEVITFKNTNTSAELATVELDITDKIDAALEKIDGLADFGVTYDNSTEVITFKNGADTITTIDLGITEKINAALTDIKSRLDTLEPKVDKLEKDMAVVSPVATEAKNTAMSAKSLAEEIQKGLGQTNDTVSGIRTDLDNLVINEYEATYGTTDDGVENTFILWENGSPKNQFVIAGGSGGGGIATTSLKVERITQSPLTVVPSDDVLIEFNCTSTDADNETYDCSYTWTIDGSIISSGTLAQGYNSFDATPYLTVGTHKLIWKIQDTAGSVTTKTWTVQVVDIRIESSFNDQTYYSINQSVSFSYTPYGSVPKTIHFILDGHEIDTVNTGSSGLLQSYTLPPQTHGAHLLECYITATINNVDVETDHIYRDIIWYDENSTTPIIGCAYRYDYYGTVSIKQYDTLGITYTVFDPTTITPTINQTIDGVDTGSQTLTSNVNTWSYKPTEAGQRTLVISCRETSVTIVLDIKPLDVEISPVTANLAFDFNPIGYSNSSNDRLWIDSMNPAITMSVSDNFDWINGGYQIDENGDQYFCVKAGTTATINYNLFENDPKKNGQEFKIIFKTANIRRRDTTFLSCVETGSTNIGFTMDVEHANISYGGNNLKTSYCENNLVEFEFNINKNTDMPIIMTYEDGTGCKPMVYTSDALNSQINPQPIIIGSDNCDVHIYRIKAYSSSLTDSDILRNFIADAKNADEMLDRYYRNQIYDDNNVLISTSANGGFSVDALMKAAPDLRYVFLEVPQFTNDKDNKIDGCKVYFKYPAGTRPQDNWTCTGMRHRGQGTSSNEYGYAGRNIDLCMDRDTSLFTWTDENGDIVESSTITLTDTSVPTDYLNIKVNIASSENANNALMARRFNEYQPFLRYARKKDSKVKDTMEFVNCVVFIRETSTDVSVPHREFNDNNWHFYAIGNIGDSKKTDDTRVNDKNDPREHVVEISDADKPLSAFPTGKENHAICPVEEWKEGNTAYDFLHNPEYTYDDGEFDKFGTESYNFRYEKDKISENDRETNINIWRDFYKFVVTSTDEEFYANLKDYFVVDSALYYYLFTERYTMVDNRAKNSFWHYGKVYISTSEAIALGETEASYYIIDDAAAAINDGYRYDLTFGYDFDTCLGIDNTGDYVFPYGKEDTDYYDGSDSKYVFRVADSVFFCRLRDLFASEMEAMFKDRESKNAWNANSLITQWDESQAQFPEELWRLDYERKYYRTYLGLSVDNSIAQGADESFLIGKFFGRKKYARRAFETNQEIYMASKYFGNTILSDTFYIRGNVYGGNNANLKQNYSLTLIPYSDMYVCVRYTSTGKPIHQRAKAGETVFFENNSEIMDFIYVDGASWIQEVGDLSRCYIDDNNFSRAIRLQKLVIGSSDDGYDNPHMKTITVANNPLLEYLDLRNISGINTVIDVSTCGNLKELHAEGTNATGVNFANGGKLQKAYLPAITSLTMKNLQNIEVFDAVNYNNLQTLVAENIPYPNTYEIVNAAINLNTIRLINIDWNASYKIPNTSILDRMYVMRGKDANNNESDSGAIVTGNFHATTVKELEKQVYQAKWPELNITQTSLVNQYVVRFINDDDDNTELDVQYVDKGQSPVDPIIRAINPIAIPTKASEPDTVFTFDKWDKWDEETGSFPAVTDGGYVVKAMYTPDVRTYKVTYRMPSELDPNETVLYTIDAVPYGTFASYQGEIPTYDDQESNFNFYLFDGWQQSGYVSGETTIYARFDSCIYNNAYFDGKNLSTLRPVELYMLTRLPYLISGFDIKNYVNPGDSLVIPFGNNFDYAGINSVDIITEPKVFNGSNYYDTNINLLDIDQDFVLAIDFEMSSTNAVNAVMAQCYDVVDNVGFRLSYNNAINVSWGNTTTDEIITENQTNETLCTVDTREMLVLRHIKGQSGLYVYSSSVNADKAVYVELPNRGNRDMTHTMSLVFGSHKELNGKNALYDNKAKGTVYWSKLWYADLGEEACKQLAYWPHETMTFQICHNADTDETLKYYRLSKTGGRTSMTFIASDLLPKGKAINENTTSNQGGWAQYSLNTYLNKRIYPAISSTWKQLIKLVQVASSEGNMSTNVTNSDCFIFIPSIYEMIGYSTASEQYNKECTNAFQISLFTTNASRICKNRVGTAVRYWTRSPKMTHAQYIYHIKEDGDGSSGLYKYPNDNSIYVRMMFCI